MRGKFFLVIRVDEDTGAMGIVNEGRVKQQITPERYLCQFTAGNRIHSRVVTLDEMLDWNFFDKPQQLDAFIQSFAAPKPPVDDDGNDGPTDPPPGNDGTETTPPIDELIDETPDDLDQLEDMIDADELFDDEPASD